VALGIWKEILERVERGGILKFIKESKVGESILLSRRSLKNLILSIRLRSERVYSPSALAMGE
jgi:hypothetical protein